MAKGDDKKRDSIFDSTNGSKTSAKSTRVKKSAAKKSAPAAPSTASKMVSAGPGGSGGGDGGGGPLFTVGKFEVLKSLLKTHEAEVLYRKGKEDRLFITGLALIAATAVGAFLIRAADDTCHGWFCGLLFKLFFASMSGLAGFTAAAMVELNRTRLQDLLAMIVKIQESFDLFVEGAYSKDGGAYLPNTYKFVGSINDDETNYAVLVLKLGAVVAAIGVLLLA